MKVKVFILCMVACGIALFLSDAHATPATCSITGVVYDGAGNAVPNATIYFNSMTTQVVSNVSIAPIVKNATTDSNGNLSAISLVQGLFIQITICQASGGGCGAPTTGVVPLNSTVTFANLLASTSAFTGQTLTGNLNAGGFRILNLGTNTTSADALSQGQSSLNNLATATGNYAMGSNKLTGLAVGTTSGDSMSFGLNHLNDLATATGAYAMGTHKVTGLAAATTSGDAMAFGLNPSESHISTVGTYGNSANFPSSTALLYAVPSIAGHFARLVCLNQSLNGGSCTTAPVVNITSTSGGTGAATVACNNVQQVSNAAAQTLTFAAGDTLSITVSTQGATCTAPTFQIDATLVYP